MSLGNTHENAREALFGIVGNFKVDATRFFEHLGERKPKSRLDFFGVEIKTLSIVEVEDVGRDDERWPKPTIPYEIVELPEIFGLAKFDSDLFQGFALCGALGRFIFLLKTTAGKRHMSRPRISFSFSSLDQEDFDRGRTLPKHKGHRRVRLGRTSDLIRFVRAQSLSKKFDLHSGRA